MFNNELTIFKINHKSVTNYCSNENKIFLVISLLHANGIINNDSINSLFKNLRKGKLNRTVNTYRSNINKQWYNYENIYDIYDDILDDMINPKSPKAILRLERINKLRRINGLEPKSYKTFLNFEEVMKYLNLFLNKNRNFCIDHLFNEYIKPAIRQSEYSISYINNMFDYDFSYFERTNSYSDDYCCEYCCGDYDDWYYDVKGRKNERIRNDITEIISEFLNTKRTKYKGSYKKFVI